MFLLFVDWLTFVVRLLMVCRLSESESVHVVTEKRLVHSTWFCGRCGCVWRGRGGVFGCGCGCKGIG